jgi:DNA polymerase zeta
MFRIAKPENFVLLSPNKNDVRSFLPHPVSSEPDIFQQVGKQNAAECMPLIMEPMSAFYSSPLVVLDFQSLYPSVMIAYNYCYSTCLGRVVPFQGQYKFGVANLDLPPGLLDALKEHITGKCQCSQCTHEFSESLSLFSCTEWDHVREATCAQRITWPDAHRAVGYEGNGQASDEGREVGQSEQYMLGSMATDVIALQTLTRVLNARQLALKYIANVTYGYTSATYSGRMPAVEIADSIVQSGRETLEKASNANGYPTTTLSRRH